VNDPADVQAVKQTVEAYAKGFSPRTLLRRCHDDGQDAFFEPHMPAMTGKDAVAKFHQMLSTSFNIDYSRRH